MNMPRTSVRRAMSLIELMAGLSACSVILTTSTVLLHRVMRAESASRAFVNVERSVTRLGHQFRQDVHRATAAVLDRTKLNSGVALKLQLPNDESLEYSHGDGNILRSQLQNGKFAAREEFDFPENVELVIDEQNSPKRIVLTITTPKPTQTTADSADRKRINVQSVPLSFQVEAVLDRDRLTANPTVAGGRSR